MSNRLPTLRNVIEIGRYPPQKKELPAPRRRHSIADPLPLHIVFRHFCHERVTETIEIKYLLDILRLIVAIGAPSPDHSEISQNTNS
ncbi:MAG: hypothetical protein DRJ61_06035 [Acidobacteria bacterium]|nr:MAG: hypothetical protein DRJ61_06035 [Acidobacteriota bacterium]